MDNPQDWADQRVYEEFVKHVRMLETRAIGGDKDAVMSLACMALLFEGWRPGPPDDGGGENVIDLAQWRKAA